MDELALAKLLADCLDAMAAGERDLDALALRTPEAFDEIRPLLDVALLLSDRRSRAPSAPPEFVTWLQERIESQYTVA